jgi:hypothetical protein
MAMNASKILEEYTNRLHTIAGCMSGLSRKGLSQYVQGELPVALMEDEHSILKSIEDNESIGVPHPLMLFELKNANMDRFRKRLNEMGYGVSKMAGNRVLAYRGNNEEMVFYVENEDGKQKVGLVVNSIDARSKDFEIFLKELYKS